MVESAYKHAKDRFKRTKYRCRDCEYAYDLSIPSLCSGEPTMCRCKHYGGGKVFKLTSHGTCTMFKKR